MSEATASGSVPAVDLPPIEIDPKTFLREHCTLPPLPLVVQELESCLRSGDVEIKHIADLMSSDPSLLAQVLKVVNSAYYGLPREVSDAKFAVAFLGLSEITRMVFCLSVINTVSVNDEESLDEYWRHSFYSALCAKSLAASFDPHSSPEDLWSSAILHDVGKLVYLKFFPGHFRAIKDHSLSNGCFFSESETTLGFPRSSYLGSLLCDHWRLPLTTRQSCEFHTLDDIRGVGDVNLSQFQRTVALGNVLSVFASTPLSEEHKVLVAEVARNALGISDDDFLLLMGNIYDLRGEVDQFMNQLR